MVFYWRQSTSPQWVQADKDDTSVSQKGGLLAWALGSDPDVNGMMLQGFVALDGHGYTTSMPLYVGDNGNPTTTTPGSGYARIIGYVVDDDTIYFDPSKVWVDIA